MRLGGSIRNRLTLWIFGLTALALIVVGLIIDYQVRSVLLSEFDRGLLVRAQGLSALTDYEEDEIDFDYTDEMMPAYADDGDEVEYFELTHANGELIARSESLEDIDDDEIAFGFSVDSAAPLGIPMFVDALSPDEEPVRLVSYVFHPPLDVDDDEGGDKLDNAELSSIKLQIIVARSTERLLGLIRSARVKLLLVFLGLMAAQALLIRFALSRGLAPLDQLATDVGLLDEDHLHLRLTDSHNVSELAPVFGQLNKTLDRLEEAFHRERSFTGNVAHELRTPIAEMRSFAEVGSKWPEDEKMAARFFDELVTLSDDMERTVTNLLTLARLESGQEHTELESLSLTSVIERCWKRLSARASARGMTLDNTVSADTTVQSDADKLSLILTNLLSNAVAHGEENSTVRIQVSRKNGELELSVSNEASDLDETDLPRMFDRFWRKDAARTRGRHVGLGLSIVRALTDLLGLTVDSRLTSAREFEVVVAGFQPG